MSKFAVVGNGYWGKNIVRTLYQMVGTRLKYVCDLDAKRLQRAKENYPTLITTDNLDEVLADPEIEGIAVATTAITHYPLAKKVLEAGKHLYIEKPMTLKVPDAQELVALAKEQQKYLMVGHILVWHPVVQKLKQLIDSGELGQVYYLYAQRLNLGKVRVDENAMWSFAPHDLSVIFSLLDSEIATISATGQHYLSDGVEDVVFLNIHFKSGQMANVHLSWLDPHKKRLLTVVGEKKMAVFDDMEPNEKLRIYDKGVEVADDYRSYGEYFTLRFGDILIPKVPMREPLYLTFEHFIKAVEEDRHDDDAAMKGLQVVQALNAAQQSLEAGGTPIKLS